VAGWCAVGWNVLDATEKGSAVAVIVTAVEVTLVV
jgi:hypothetical protein